MAGESDLGLTAHERAVARAYFAMSVHNMIEADAYWCPDLRRVVFRRVNGVRPWAPPVTGILVGRYTHGFPAREFLGDLEDILKQLARLGSLPA